MNKHRHKIKIILGGGILLFLFNCTSIPKVQAKLQEQYRSGNFKKAVKTIEGAKKKYRSRNSLLYYLDYGLALHHAEKHEASNLAFEKAKVISQQHHTKSVSAQTASFLINDNVLPYYGEDFEQICIRLFSSLNYLKLNSVEGALVEMRQADALLKRFETDHGGKNTYIEDAFLRYFSGMLYEKFGDFNNAQVAYYKAWITYQKNQSIYKVDPPPELLGDIYRVAKILGFRERIEEIKQVHGYVPNQEDRQSELVLLHFNGFAPHKNEFFFEISLFAALPYLEAEEVSSQDELEVNQAKAMMRSIGGKQLIRVAFPRMKDTSYKVKNSIVESQGINRPTRLVQNIGKIAKQSMEDKSARVKGKTIARTVVKYITAHTASAVVGAEKGAAFGFLTQAIMQAVNTASERADTRSWRTLPNEIRMARIPLPPGDHSMKVKFLNKKGDKIKSKTINVSIQSGEKKIFPLHSFQ